MVHYEKPIVSIICSVKNGSETIGEVLDSIRKQTLQEWEMIIVDDGSSDDTLDVILRYAEPDSRIRLIPTDGVGRGRALNLALEHARAEYVANIDADDPCHPMRLQVQCQLLREHQEYAVLGTDTTLFFGDEQPQWVDLTSDQIHDAPIRDVTRLLTRLCPINHSSVLMKRGALESVGGYDERRSAQYDYDLWVRLAWSGYRIGRVKLPLAGKRIHRGQYFERRRRIRFLRGSAEVQFRAIRLLGGGPVDYFYLLARPLWGLLPNQLRMTARRKLNRLTLG